MDICYRNEVMSCDVIGSLEIINEQMIHLYFQYIYIMFTETFWKNVVNSLSRENFIQI